MKRSYEGTGYKMKIYNEGYLAKMSAVVEMEGQLEAVDSVAAVIASSLTDLEKRNPSEAKPKAEIPAILYNPTTKAMYDKGKLLGKGGFAKCFEVTDLKTNAVYACKIVNKSLLKKEFLREKMAQEIKIHRDLKHEFIVGFMSYFEDVTNVYILMELCTKKTLLELQKRRRVITEPEARFFLREIALAVAYLHGKMIIHRDIKLGNILISENIHLKLGDFGLATSITEGERKQTLCGTPNYISPEVLSKKGHSYEVDIWSIGCILYTLLVGKPPFETETLKETYFRIKRGEFEYPQNSSVSPLAKALLSKLLQVSPALRPSAKEILAARFMTQGVMPLALPPSVLTTSPRFDKLITNSKLDVVTSETLTTPQKSKSTVGADCFLLPAPESSEEMGDKFDRPVINLLKTLRYQISQVLELSHKRNITLNDDESENPSLSPVLYVSKWVDYSDKYGFGYQLCDESIGVSFNDSSKITLLSDKKSIHYINADGKEFYHSRTSHPEELTKKVKLLNYFQKYMQQNLLKASGGGDISPENCIARVPNLWTWFRTSRSVVMVLSNGTVQINNVEDHDKMILCPLLGAITTIESNKSMRTHKLNLLEFGLSKKMLERLKYAFKKTDLIISNYDKNKIGKTGVILSPTKH